MTKQRLDPNEQYFVHIGFTYVNELKKYSHRYNKYRKCKMRDVVAKRIDKLKRYWKASLK